MIRRTPLKRSTKPLRRTPLKRVSRKRAKENRVYSQLRATYLGLHPYCQAHHILSQGLFSADSTDIHHIAGRGSKLNDTGLWLAVCRNCHDWIHAHPSEARKLRLLA